LAAWSDVRCRLLIVATGNKVKKGIEHDPGTTNQSSPSRDANLFVSNVRLQQNERGAGGKVKQHEHWLSFLEPVLNEIRSAPTAHLTQESVQQRLQQDKQL